MIVYSCTLGENFAPLGNLEESSWALAAKNWKKYQSPKTKGVGSLLFTDELLRPPPKKKDFFSKKNSPLIFRLFGEKFLGWAMTHSPPPPSSATVRNVTQKFALYRNGM